MPATYTHYCFAKTLVKDEWFKGNERALILGTQGPDPFFAYGSLPWAKKSDKKEVNQFGSYVHHIDVSLLYLKMGEYANKSEDKELLLSYVYGLLLHYCLDRFCHPFIFYRSGFDEQGYLTYPFNFSHGVFESMLDRLVIKNTRTFVSPKKAFPCKKDELRKISLMWSKCAKNECIKDETFFLAVKDHLGSMKAIRNLTGLKRVFYKLLQKKIPGYNNCVPRYCFKAKKLNVDNIKKERWLDPFSGEEHNESIYDLFVVASSFFLKAKDLLDKHLSEGHKEKEFSTLINAIHHDGGPVGSLLKHRSGELFK